MNIEQSFPTGPSASEDEPVPFASQQLSDEEIMRLVNGEMSPARISQPESKATLVAFYATLVACVCVGIVALNRMQPGATIRPAAAVAASESGTPRWINWTYSLEEGQSRARASHSKVLIDFYTDWCPGCKWVDSAVYTRPDVLAESQNVAMVKINAEGRRDLAQRYNITVYPSFIWTDENGNVTARQEGSTGASEFALLMAQNR